MIERYTQKSTRFQFDNDFIRLGKLLNREKNKGRRTSEKICWMYQKSFHSTRIDRTDSNKCTRMNVCLRLLWHHRINSMTNNNIVRKAKTEWNEHAPKRRTNTSHKITNSLVLSSELRINYGEYITLSHRFHSSSISSLLSLSLCLRV